MSLQIVLDLPERGVDVDLEVPTGQTLALLGPNGAGKTTIVEAVCGLVRPHTGTIRIDQRTLTAVVAGRTSTFVAPHRRNVGLLAQSALLFPHLTVLDNVAFGPRSHGVRRAAARATAQAWLDRVEVGELAHRRPAQLSGGQAQRVAIARALATEPDVLLLDEPLAALDAQITPALRRALQDVLAERTTILVTHDLLDAVQLADRVVVLDQGMVVETGPVLDVLTQPRSAFTARLADLNMAAGTWQGDHLLSTQGLRIEGRVAGGEISIGHETVAVFRPAAVSIYRDPPIGSPRNQWRVRITDIQPQGGVVRVRADGLSADITPTSVATLALAPGDEVHFSVKATDVTIYRR